MLVGLTALSEDISMNFLTLFTIVFSTINLVPKILFLIPLLGLCISLKTYFLPYIFLGLLIIFLNIKKI